MDLESLNKINAIIERDRTDASYKYALLRAVIDICQTQSHWGEEDGDKVWYPMGFIVENWIFSYYPLLESVPFIPQKRGEPHGKHFILFRPEMEKLIESYRSRGGYQVFAHDYHTLDIPEDIQPLLYRLIHKIRKTVADMPMKHLGYSYSHEIYSVLSPERPLRRMPISVSGDRHELIRLAGRFSVDRDLADVFAHLGGFISGEEGIVQKWASFCADADSTDTIGSSHVIDILKMTPDNEHDTYEARRIYEEEICQKGSLNCVWTGNPIKYPQKMEVDHILPFSVWKNNDLWNLMPSSIKANRDKTDLIPSTELLEDRKLQILKYCGLLRQKFIVRFENEMKISLLGETEPDLNIAFEKLKDKCRYLIETRGYTPWDGDD